MAELTTLTPRAVVELSSSRAEFPELLTTLNKILKFCLDVFGEKVDLRWGLVALQSVST
jgi:hypothetical protein